jgi:hypothetical protein
LSKGSGQRLDPGVAGLEKVERLAGEAFGLCSLPRQPPLAADTFDSAPYDIQMFGSEYLVLASHALSPASILCSTSIPRIVPRIGRIRRRIGRIGGIRRILGIISRIARAVIRVAGRIWIRIDAEPKEGAVSIVVKAAAVEMTTAMEAVHAVEAAHPAVETAATVEATPAVRDTATVADKLQAAGRGDSWGSVWALTLRKSVCAGERSKAQQPRTSKC